MVEYIRTPGAMTSSPVPKLLKLARLSVSSIAPTPMTFGKAAGYVSVLVPLLPAAATSTTPLLAA